MAVSTFPYLTFADSAAEALEHYRGIFGGTVTICTYGDAGVDSGPDAHDVFRGTLTTAAGCTIVCVDTPVGMILDAGRMTVGIDGDDPTQLETWLAALADGGILDLPLSREGGVALDRFGVRWVLRLSGQSMSSAASVPPNS